MFGRAQRPCRVYEYGCLAPLSGEDAAIGEMKRRDDLWNKLVEIEREYSAKVASLLQPEEDPVAPLQAKLKELRKKIKEKRKRARSGQVDVADLVAEVARVKAEIASAKETAQAIRKAKAEEHKAALDALEAERKAKVKEARAASGLYWCNYGEVEDSYAIARKRVMQKRAAKKRAELHFHKWDGTGKVTVRYQTGLPVAKVFGNDTRLQIDPVPEEAWTSPVRAERRKLARTKVRLRVQSDESLRPVWVELPMVMHRPLPADGVIRSASVIRERVGRKFRWKVVITVALASSPAPANRPGTIAIDIGWRATPSGLRVAYWYDDSGDEGQVVLGPEIVEPFCKLSDLKSIRDRMFNACRDKLVEWLAEHKDIVPNWLREETQGLSAWRSQGRLVALVERWRASRFPGDEEIMAELEHWRSRERHLYDWEANQRDQVQRRRREQYRIFAAGIAKKYGRVVLEDFDLSQVARKPAAEQGTSGTLPPDRQRFIASPSELRSAIVNAAQREGVEVIFVPAAESTITCHVCGHVERFEADSHLYHRCGRCGTLWDQDANAAMVLLARGAQKLAV